MKRRTPESFRAEVVAAVKSQSLKVIETLEIQGLGRSAILEGMRAAIDEMERKVGDG